MNKEKAIQAMANDLEDCQSFVDMYGEQLDFFTTARNLYNKGYCKASEVKKKTAKHIYKRLFDLCFNKDKDTWETIEISKYTLFEWAKEDGVEVE